MLIHEYCCGMGIVVCIQKYCDVLFGKRNIIYPKIHDIFTAITPHDQLLTFFHFWPIFLGNVYTNMISFHQKSKDTDIMIYSICSYSHMVPLHWLLSVLILLVSSFFASLSFFFSFWNVALTFSVYSLTMPAIV